MTYYKSFRSDGRTLHGRDAWPLPEGEAPGEWLEVEGPLEPCVNGLHVMCEPDLAYWPGWHLYEAEVDGKFIEAPHKVVARRARLVRRVESWGERVLYLWLADCAEHVLHIYERAYPGDDRPRRAIGMLRAWARGEASRDDLVRAMHEARCASEDASADEEAIGVVMWAADTALVCLETALADTPEAAASLLDEAVGTAAAAAHDRDTERRWQSQRMLAYIRGEVK